MSIPLISFLVLDYKKPIETNICLSSIRQNAKFNHQIIYLDNGSNSLYPMQFHETGLADYTILKKHGNGGGYGQTDLFRFCNTKYSIFVQSDQYLARVLDENTIKTYILLLDSGFQCIDMNGDQSGKGIWTDRAHMIKTDLFNKLGPFPNGGPGLDAVPWNEAYLQEQFQKRQYKIFHAPVSFIDNGRTSVRQSEYGGIFEHETDTKRLKVLQIPSKANNVYPILNNKEWDLVLNGQWVDGTIPEASQKDSFVVPQWH